MTQPLTRPEIIRGAVAEYEGFAALLDSLDDKAWRTATRCDGFEVRDVAGHVVGLANDVTLGVPGSRTADEEAASLRDFTPQEVAKHLRTSLEGISALVNALDDDAAWNGPSPIDGLTLGRGVLTLWYDTYVHADDIRAAIGQPSQAGDGVRASVEYLQGELASRGFAPIPTDIADPLLFVLIATGRADASQMNLDPSVNIYADA